MRSMCTEWVAINYLLIQFNNDTFFGLGLFPCLAIEKTFEYYVNTRINIRKCMLKLLASKA